MGFNTEHDVALIAGKQSGFGAIATVGRVVPIVKGGQGPTHERDKVDNDARFQDTFKREFVLGNHKSGVDLQAVPNLDWLGYPLHGWTGGFTDSGAGPTYTHAAVPTKNVIYYSYEESFGNIATTFYQYFDQVYSEYNFELDSTQSSLFKPTFKTVGSGKLVKSATTFDAAASEVAGPPVEVITWSTLTNGADEGNVTKLSVNCKREVLEVRPSGSNGLCTGLRFGETTITGTLTVLFDSDVAWNRARSGTIFALKATLLSGTASIEHLLSEVKLVPTSPKKQSGQFVMGEFAFESFKKTDSNSPIKITLINGVTTHNA
jgi:hypothetical protein